MVDPVKKDNIFWIFYRFGNSGGIAFEYFGVFYKEIMYYLSTNPNMNVVKHFLDEGKVNTVIENSGIPNQHFLASITRKLQGHSFFCCFCALYPLNETEYGVIWHLFSLGLIRTELIKEINI